MAKDKTSFLLYSDLIYTVNKLPDDIAGRLFKHILLYVNDEDPITEDIILQVAFEPIRQSLKRDLKKYESICERNRENARKRWDKKNTTACDRIPKDTKHTDSDNDNDSDNDINNIYYTLKNFKLTITEKEHKKLLTEFTEKQIKDIYNAIDNDKNTKNKVSLYRTALKWLRINQTPIEKNTAIYKKECESLNGTDNEDVKFYFKLLREIKSMPDLLKKGAITYDQAIKIKNYAKTQSVKIFDNLELIAGSENVRYNKALNIGFMTWIKENSKAL